MILAALMVIGGRVSFSDGIVNPVEEGLKLSEPTVSVLGSLSWIDFMSKSPLDFVRPERSSKEPLTAWLDENYRRATLKDHLEIIVPPPDHLADTPSSATFELEAQALAPAFILIDKNR